MKTKSRTLTFNGPLEAGVRAVAILFAAFPKSFDVQRLTALDYLIVRTAELGGPSNIHPDAPIKTPATEVRRALVQEALLLMMTRDLVSREMSSDGIQYLAGETAATFMLSIETPYMLALKERAEWVVEYLAPYSEQDFAALMRGFFDDWVMEFHEQSGSGSTQ